MNIKKENLTYIELEPGAHTQYPDYDPDEGIPVEACYIEPSQPELRGNPFIAALPPRPTPDYYLKSCERMLADYDFEKQRMMDTESRIDRMQSLDYVRFPMPSGLPLVTEIDRALRSSYRSRHQMISQREMDTPMPEGAPKAKGKAAMNNDCGCPAGFAFVDVPGCGKTTTIRQALSHWPRVIVHRNIASRMTQIVHLFIDCTTLSTFSDLFPCIGRAVDEALGFTTPVHEAAIAAKGQIAKMASAVCDLIDRYAIGLIVIDEIQLMRFDDYSQPSANSFNAFLSLTNRTSVAIAIVGTVEAYTKIFKTVYLARRIGPVIRAGRYCSDAQYIDYIVKRLFHYQWFDEYITPTKAIVHKLGHYSQGSIGHIRALYQSITLLYLRTPPEKRPHGEIEFLQFIDQVIAQRHSVLAEKIRSQPTIEKTKGLLDAEAQKIWNELDVRDEAEQVAFRNLILSESGSDSGLKEKLIFKLHEVYPLFDYETIQNVIEYSTAQARHTDDEQAIIKAAMQYLDSQPDTRGVI